MHICECYILTGVSYPKSINLKQTKNVHIFECYMQPENSDRSTLLIKWSFPFGTAQKPLCKFTQLLNTFWVKVTRNRSVCSDFKYTWQKLLFRRDQVNSIYKFVSFTSTIISSPFLACLQGIFNGRDKMDRSWREEWKYLCLKKKKKKLRHVKTQDKIKVEIFYTLSDYKKCKWCFVLKNITLCLDTFKPRRFVTGL